MGASSRCSGTINDDYGHQMIVGDIERLFQLLNTDPGSILPTGTNGEPMAVQTIDICVNGVAMKMDILATAPYLATS